MEIPWQGKSGNCRCFAHLRTNLHGFRIVTLQLSSLKKKLSARDIQIDFSQGVVEFLTEKSYIPEFGARPVKRAIDDNIINPLSLELLSGNIDKTKPIKVIGDNQELRFEN